MRIVQKIGSKGRAGGSALVGRATEAIAQTNPELVGKATEAAKQVGGAAAVVTAGVAKVATQPLSETVGEMKERKQKFKRLIEMWLLQKVHETLEKVIDRFPRMAKDFFEDPDMPRCASRGKDQIVDGIWPDVKEEVLWTAAVALDGKKDLDGGAEGDGVCCCLAFFRYHLHPYDKSIWGRVRDPVFFVLKAISAIPYFGIYALAFAFFFMIIDKRDEYQLITFILQFKGTQFISHGILKSLLGFFLFVSCVSAPGQENRHACDERGPGVQGRIEVIFFSWFLQVVLVWIAFFLLKCSKTKGRAELKGKLVDTGTGFDKKHSDAYEKSGEDLPPSDSRKRWEKHFEHGGYLRYLLFWDMACFICCAAALVIIVMASPRKPKDQYDNWAVAHALFACQVVYGFLSMPFALFEIPLLQIVLTHALATGYDRKGRVCKYKGPERPKSDDGGPCNSFLKTPELFTKDSYDKLFEKVKNLMQGGTVKLEDDDEERPAAAIAQSSAPPQLLRPQGERID